MLGTMMDYPLVLSVLLERARRLFPDVEVVSRRMDGTRLRRPYRAIHARATALAAALVRAGMRRGDRVGTLMWNHAEHLEGYFGIPAAGGVLHTLNLRLAADDVAYIINHAGDRFLIVDECLLPLFAQVRARVALERVLVVRHSDAPLPEGLEDYEAFIAPGAAGFVAPALGENDAAGMCYTSGTTGRPKGVVYSHRALVLHSMCLAMADTLGMRNADTVMPIVPMFHVNAWGQPFTAPMVGARLVFPGPAPKPEDLLDLMAEEGVTLASGVPTVWMGMVQALDGQPGRWKLAPGVRAVIGGAAPNEGLLRALQGHGIAVRHGWGLTETTPLAACTHAKHGLGDLAPDSRLALTLKQGLPVPLIEARIVNDDGEAAWDGRTSGELQVRGPWVAAGYYEEPGTGDKWTADGWFATGDIATIDPEGYIQLTDRAKDLIKSGGEWISSVALESALMDHAAVREAAVIAVPHPKWQERPLAAVVLKDGAAATAEQLGAHLASRFAKWWLPDAYVFIDQIPRTSTGKFQKTVLRERYRDWRWG